LPTVGMLIFKAFAISVLVRPLADSSTIRQRSAIA